jgi:hypothetical protein
MQMGISVRPIDLPCCSSMGWRPCTSTAIS